MNRVVYVISSTQEYWEAIRDVGPMYAKDIGLPCVRFDDWTGENGAIAIFDQRLSPSEVVRLRVAGERDPGIRVILRFVDPFYEGILGREFASLAFEWSRRPQTAVLSAYEPKEVVSFLKDAYGRHRFHVSQYPYLQASELSRSWGTRERKVIISGNNAPGMYPWRSFARLKRHRSLAWRRMSRDLAHPGYLASKAQGVTGVEYLQLLADHQMMLVCPGRSLLEFMKYRECALAGCVPVGMAADGLPPDAAACVLPFEWTDFRGSMTRLRALSSSDLEDIATAYRKAMRTFRDPLLLRSQLMDWIASLG
jgi:hypothetical protein